MIVEFYWDDVCIFFVIVWVGMLSGVVDKMNMGIVIVFCWLDWLEQVLNVLFFSCYQSGYCLIDDGEVLFVWVEVLEYVGLVFGEVV